jgi:hypothetical protein
MKKMYLATVLALLAFGVEGYGSQSMKQANYHYGYQTFGKETVNFIQANGTVVLDGTKVLGLVQVNGTLEADEASMEGLQINGQAALKNCLISNDTHINGSLNADNTKFQKDLSVASQKITLRICSVDHLTVRPVEGYNGVQIIDLRSGTKVTGPIVVESGNGEVWLSSNSEVAGDISGAKVIRK